MIENEIITTKNNKSKNILMDKMANEWLEIASKIPDPKPLFGNIWHQGEVGILFSNTGKGKSILAVQLADAISKGKTLLETDIEAYNVLYFDFELSTKAFQQRYTSNNSELYSFSNKFIRAEIDRTQNLEDKKVSLEQLIIDSIKTQAIKNKAEVLIIDNITFLSASNEKSHEALALMKLILDLSRKNNISILLIAHTPKRDIYSPIQLEDLAGSKALSNFVDVCFCIGESILGSNIRYIKQLKNRNYPIEYGSDNVINCTISKDASFLKFNIKDFGAEKNHLQTIRKDKRQSDAKNLKDSGRTNVEIAKLLGVNERTIRRWLKIVEIGH
ncbi:MAG: AAA family ATPase [Algibacter sp.]|uniref:AAA family ATPase n=1 Tax=Algibacter sp. TaxID=1872428 RepID=UPI002639BB37|nr:AAA family ATPase [Algibacter sp.]MDG1730964.1 AAA family ATPase [Algibacter sp.]